MDHWGDPWADGNANNDKSPTKNELPSPLPPAQPSAPGLLNGFLDDAGWGNDESFGDWTTSAEVEDTKIAPATHIADSGSISKDDDSQSDSGWGTGFERVETLQYGEADWSMPSTDKSEDLDIGKSDASHSPNTARADDTLESIETDIPIQISADHSSSAHPSISSSESSRNEAPTETPRTSIEEEHDHDKQAALIQEIDEELVKEDEEETIKPLSRPESVSGGADHETEAVQKEAPWADEDTGRTESVQPYDKRVSKDFKEVPTARDEYVAAARSRRAAAAVAIEQTLLDQLFPDPSKKPDLDDAHDDPIYSTAGRKAWYRLTRKQTLREYNIGTADDNHIRVTWANSHIRSEVNKIVGRWAREDRISGTGAGARASFYWDTTGPVDPVGLKRHTRKRSSISNPRNITPNRQSLPVLAANTPAAFSWSNPSVPATRKLDQPTSTTSENLQNIGNALEAEPQSGNESQTQVPARPISIPPPISRPPVFTPASPVSLKDTSTDDYAAEPVEDEDDEWGEMVTGGEESNEATAESPTHLTSPHNILSNASSPPFSQNALLSQDQSADTNPAPIVRLKSTISPTSRLFPQRFIPLHAEEGPIGPAILKRFSRSASGKKEKEVQSLLNPEPVPVEPTRKETVTFDWSDSASPQKTTLLGSASSNHEDDDGLLDTTSKTLRLDTFNHPPASQQPATSTPFNIDSWADADFSFFDAAPPTTQTSTLSQPKPDPSDPFSIFETSSISTTPVQPAVSSNQPSVTSTPLETFAPVFPPLNNAGLKSTSQLKEEEDRALQAILSGLPDLRYMLRA